MSHSTEVVRYTYRLRPGAQAEAALLAEWGRCRWLWNEAVHLERIGRRPTRAKLAKLLTQARKANTWLREGSQNAQACMLNTYAKALDHSFQVKGRGRPKVKKRKTSRPSLEYTRNGFSIRDGRLRLPKGVTVPVLWSRGLASEPSSVRVYQDSLGHWYVSFVVVREVERMPEAGGGVGIDWGVRTTATATDPAYDLEHVGARKAVAADLKTAQQAMARRRRPKNQPQSKGCKRAKLAAAKVSKKAQRRNTHLGCVWARPVVADHQLIAVEDFKPRFLASSTMARKAADAAIRTVKKTLVEYGERAGRKVVLVRPAYTSMTCSRCFARAKRLMLDERTFACTACGLVADRDVNAARVILAVAERGHTSVEDARHDVPPSGGACRVCEVEIPRL